MGGLFRKPEVPKVETPAPSITNPETETDAPEMGAQETAEQKKKKGKKSLKIDLTKSGGSGGAGANVP